MKKKYSRYSIIESQFQPELESGFIKYICVPSDQDALVDQLNCFILKK